MTTQRYSSIDLLRFFAASTVALAHLMITKNGFNISLEIISSMAVEVFFIISGFVLAPQIIKIVQSNDINVLKIFLLRRWYRTIPLYVLSLILTSIALNKIFSIDIIKYLFFLQNFFNSWIEDDYFSISWSLSVEEWFYVLFPTFLILLSGIFKKTNNKELIVFTLIFIFLFFLIIVVIVII